MIHGEKLSREHTKETILSKQKTYQTWLWSTFFKPLTGASIDVLKKFLSDNERKPFIPPLQNGKYMDQYKIKR